MATEMATATTEKNEAVSDGITLLFELENVAVPGRKRLYDLLKKSLTAAGVQLNPGLFSRFGLKPTAEQCVASLVENAGSGKGNAEKIGAEVSEAFSQELRGKIEANPAVVKLLQSAAKKGFRIGALSALAEEDATAVLQKLGLAGDVKLSAHKPTEPNYPHAESWVKLLKLFGKSTAPAVAIVSSQLASKTALAAGLRVVVLPDEFTSFQDFGGADIVVDSAEDLSVADIIATIAVK